MTEIEQRTSLVDELLADQSKLGTAVSRFSDWHDDTTHTEPLQARYYRNLIPLQKPAKGEQYAFEVNLDQCTGCKACVVACHALNGLDDNESWRDVGLLLGDECTSYQQTVTSACHHCLDPACASGCPVLAYEKDLDTGIVRHLDDQCIGCSYCILKCPYDVPKFNDARGIVRKCDMCHQRLAAGEAPACVQACPTSAIAIRIVKVEEVRSSTTSSGALLLPSTMVSSYTLPTTRYVSSKPVPVTSDAADAEKPRLEEAHTPLAVMLVLTQLATGALLFAQNAAMRWFGFATAVVGIVASVSHLGQPFKAWRCFLGWRRSWLSREILAFGVLPPLAMVNALQASPQLLVWLPGPAWIHEKMAWTLFLLPPWSAAAAGVVSVFCSVMVYVDTRRPWWSMKWTGPKFFGTVLAGGVGLAACFNLSFAFAAAILGALKLAWESLYLSSDDPRDRRSQRLLLGPLRHLHGARFLCGLCSCVLTARRSPQQASFSSWRANSWNANSSSTPPPPGRCPETHEQTSSSPDLSRAERSAHLGAGAEAGALRPGQRAGATSTRGTGEIRVWLLFDRLRAENSSR